MNYQNVKDEKLDKYIGIWGLCHFGDVLIKENGDVENRLNYPFSNQLHKCIDTDGNYLKVKFCGIILKILPHAFYETDSPDFLPFESIKYVSSKGKLEFGTVVAYRMLIKPYLRRVYQLEVKGKVKSSLYDKDQLERLKSETDLEGVFTKLSKTVSMLLRHSPEDYGIKLDENGWSDLEELVAAIKSTDQEWASLRYHDLLLMIDSSKKERHELKTIRVGKEYRNNFKWFIRAKYTLTLKDKIEYDSQP
jgi:hypothetical protein